MRDPELSRIRWHPRAPPDAKRPMTDPSRRAGHSARLFLPTVALLAASGLAPERVHAQTPTSRFLPADRESTEAHESIDFPFGHTVFLSQQIFEAADVASRPSALFEIAFRYDRPRSAIRPTTLPNVTVRLGTTQIPPTSMASSFAQNRGTPLQTVFQGAVMLPAANAQDSGTAPFAIRLPLNTPVAYDPAQGNLLIEIECGSGPSSRIPVDLDAVVQGGRAITFGQRGPAGGDNLFLIAHTGPDFDPRMFVPGGFVDLSTTTSFAQYPGFLMVGLDADRTAAGVPLPFDLGRIGARGNQLAVDPLGTIPHNWQQTFIGWSSTATLPVPNDPTLAGLTLYAQSLVQDPSFNAPGLATSEALELGIGDSGPARTSTLGSTDPTSATGTLVVDGFGFPKGAVVELVGLF